MSPSTPTTATPTTATPTTATPATATPAASSRDVRRFDHWIGGAPRPSERAEHLDSWNPATGELVAQVARGTPGDVDAAVAAASAAQPGWAVLPPVERVAHLTAIASAIRDDARHLAATEVSETGKLDADALSEVEGAAAFFDYYASALRFLRGETIDLGADRHVFTRHEPYGVVGVITPWNGPLNQAARAVAPAIAVGNAVVVKPSEFTSVTTLELARIASEVGLPPGVLNVVTGDGADTGAPLVQNPAVARVSFTGSVLTGRRVAQLAAERLIPVSLELGGKSPHIIFADADLDAACAAAAASFTANAGQICAAGTRLIVERGVHDEVVDRIVRIARAKKPGVGIGPIITPAQFAKVQGFLEAAVVEGAVPATGGRVDPDAGDGMYIEPTVYTGVTSGMRIAREEIFGPVLSVLAFDTVDEAIRIANDTSYGLASGVWTSHIDKAFAVAHAMQAGTVSVNDWASSIETPFGGYKQSGYGREKGAEALREYTQLKSVMVRLR